MAGGICGPGTLSLAEAGGLRWRLHVCGTCANVLAVTTLAEQSLCQVQTKTRATQDMAN